MGNVTGALSGRGIAREKLGHTTLATCDDRSPAESHRSEIKVDDNNKNSLNFAISSHNTNVDTRAGIGLG